MTIATGPMPIGVGSAGNGPIGEMSQYSSIGPYQMRRMSTLLLACLMNCAQWTYEMVVAASCGERLDSIGAREHLGLCQATKDIRSGALP